MQLTMVPGLVCLVCVPCIGLFYRQAIISPIYDDDDRVRMNGKVNYTHAFGLHHASDENSSKSSPNHTASHASRG